jgi:hypothetical protein
MGPSAEARRAGDAGALYIAYKHTPRSAASGPTFAHVLGIGLGSYRLDIVVADLGDSPERTARSPRLVSFRRWRRLRRAET